MAGGLDKPASWNLETFCKPHTINSPSTLFNWRLLRNQLPCRIRSPAVSLRCYASSSGFDRVRVSSPVVEMDGKVSCSWSVIPLLSKWIEWTLYCVLVKTHWTLFFFFFSLWTFLYVLDFSSYDYWIIQIHVFVNLSFPFLCLLQLHRFSFFLSFTIRWWNVEDHMDNDKRESMFTFERNFFDFNLLENNDFSFITL